MAKRSVGYTTVRGVVSVGDPPLIEGLGVWRRSLDIVVREQGNRKLRLRMTKKNARELRTLLMAALP